MSDRCFSSGLLILCVSLPGPEAVLAWSRFGRFSDGSGLYSLPGLETLSYRVYGTCTAAEICTCTADRSTPARPLFSSHPLYFGVFQIKISVFHSFVITLLSGRAALWGTTVWEQKLPCCASFQLFSEEIRKVFDRAASGREAARLLAELRQGDRSVTDFSMNSALWRQSAGGTQKRSGICSFTDSLITSRTRSTHWNYPRHWMG